MKEISESIKVYVRQRPYLGVQEDEHQLSEKNDAVQSSSSDCTSCTYVSTQNKLKQKFSVEHFFDTLSPQDSLYDSVAKPIIESSLLGYSGLILAYGPTGSGKTHTMRGGENENRGIIPRCIEEILNQSKSRKIELWASYMQIYCETVTDLLPAVNNNNGTTDSANLNIREKPDSQGVYVEGLNKYQITSLADLWEILSRGDENRYIASTNCNETSSRSHAILLLSILIFDDPIKGENGSSTKGVVNNNTISCKEGQLVLVDLAGSERARASEGREYMRLEEAKAINLSLSALGNCMNALAYGKTHIPYRDSKLTRLLSNSLNGKSRTSIIVTVLPGPDPTGETLNTLRFASRATKVKVVANISQYYNYEELYQQTLQKLQLLENQQQPTSSNQSATKSEDVLALAKAREEELLQQVDTKNILLEQQTLEIALLKQQLASVNSGTKANVTKSDSENDEDEDDGIVDYAMKYKQLQEEIYTKQTLLHEQYGKKLSILQLQITKKSENIEELQKKLSALQTEYLTQLTKYRILSQEKQTQETECNTRIQEILSELNDKQNKLEDVLVQMEQYEIMMKEEMVSQSDFQLMESRFLATIERLATRVQLLEQQKQQLPSSSSSSNSERVAVIEPGGRIRPTYPIPTNTTATNNNAPSATTTTTNTSSKPVKKKEDAVSSYFTNLDAKANQAMNKKGSNSIKYSSSATVL